MRSIEAEELRIVDRNGIVRGLFRAVDAPGHVTLDLLNPAGLVTVALGVDADSSSRISLVDERGSVLIGIGSQADGRLGVNVLDTQGRPAMLLEVLPDGSRKVAIYDVDGSEICHGPESGPAVAQSEFCSSRTFAPVRHNINNHTQRRYRFFA